MTLVSLPNLAVILAAHSFFLNSAHGRKLPVNFFAHTVASVAVDLNVTALKGQDAKLPCSIDSLETNLTVVWMDKHENVLYFNENRMIDDERFTLSQLNRNWDLIVRQVDLHDQGSYRCVANTRPIKLKYYQLTVYVPPRIDLDNSSPDVEASEGTSVKLQCNATGYPAPTISWAIRLASKPRNSTDVKRLAKEGETLLVQNVSRYLDEIYTCIASNGFGVADEHDIRIRVRFKPEVRTPQMKISRYVGESVRLICSSEGYRLPRIYFAKDGLEILDDVMQTKYKYNWEYIQGGNQVRMSLEIYQLEEDDFGYYKCVAVNSLGRGEKFIEVKETRRVIVTTPRRRPQQVRILTTSLKQATKRPKPRQPPELIEQKNRLPPNPALSKQSQENSAAAAAISQTGLLLAFHVVFFIL